MIIRKRAGKARFAATSGCKILALCAAAGLSMASAAVHAVPDWSKVDLKVVWDLDRASWSAMESRVTDAVVASLSAESRNFEVLSASPELPAPGAPNGDMPAVWTAVAYDYANETGWRYTVAPSGEIVAKTPYVQARFENQPVPSEREFANAVAFIEADPRFGDLMRSGEIVAYEAMPPVDYTPGAPRMLNVGLEAKSDPDMHEIVSVVMRTGEVMRFEGKAPNQARADRGSCGPSSGGGCPNNDTGSGMASVSWPAVDPVWTFDVVRPSRTNTSATSNGAGVELRNVRYNGELVLLSANVPVLNVFYTGNACGPFRDWLFQESCFDVSGGVESPAGIYTSENVSSTICVDATDAGNFRGVGIQTTPDAIILVSEMSAGWYRYLNGWKLYSNGDIKADFFYAGTFNSCTCNERVHNAYWRFDWAIDGVADAGGPGGFLANNKPQRRDMPMPDSTWTDLTSEQARTRTATYNAVSPEFRVWNETTSTGYEVVPSKPDGTADTNGVSDVWFLKWNSTETDDTGFGSAINLNPYFSSPQAIGEERFVMWYGGHLYQSGGESGGANTCAEFGPLLRRVQVVPNPRPEIASSVGAATNQSPVSVAITFTESVTGFEEADLTVANATTSNFSGSGDAYSVDLTPSAQGAVSLSVAADVAMDTDGNGNSASQLFSFEYDTVRPSLGLASAANDPTNASPIPVTFTFSESVSGFAAGDIAATNATVSGVSGGPAVYTANLTPTGQGAVSATVGEDAATDAATNASTASNNFQIVFDSVAPTAALATSAPAFTNASPIAVTFTFSENVSGFAASDLTLVNATASNFAGGPAVYTADLTPAGQGVVSARLAAGVCQDAATNVNAATATLFVTFDTVAPTMELTSSTSPNTSKSPIPLTITFAEAVTEFEETDLVLGNATAQNFAGGPTVYTVELVPVADGVVTASLGAGAARDAAGNPSAASAEFSRVFSATPPQPSGVIVGNSVK